MCIDIDLGNKPDTEVLGCKDEFQRVQSGEVREDGRAYRFLQKNENGEYKYKWKVVEEETRSRRRLLGRGEHGNC